MHANCGMAERVGFEPTVPLPGRMLSKHVDSSTLAPLRIEKCQKESILACVVITGKLAALVITTRRQSPYQESCHEVCHGERMDEVFRCATAMDEISKEPGRIIHIKE